jgi:hypothetical protein
VVKFRYTALPLRQVTPPWPQQQLNEPNEMFQSSTP